MDTIPVQIAANLISVSVPLLTIAERFGLTAADGDDAMVALVAKGLAKDLADAVKLVGSACPPRSGKWMDLVDWVMDYEKVEARLWAHR